MRLAYFKPSQFVPLNYSVSISVDILAHVYLIMFARYLIFNHWLLALQIFWWTTVIYKPDEIFLEKLDCGRWKLINFICIPLFYWHFAKLEIWKACKLQACICDPICFYIWISSTYTYTNVFSEKYPIFGLHNRILLCVS